MYIYIKQYLNKTSPSSSLALYRLLFGLLLFFSIIRFWFKGWIKDLYITPNFHFSYYGFEWANPIGDYTYIIFIICALSALFVSLGFKYRISIIVFFLSFLYIELLDKTTYLNHYYLISITSFLLIFLPANASFSIDNIITRKRYNEVPKWTIDSLKLLISIVYVYAAISKINSDWLLEAMPLKIWIASKYDFPLIGETLFQKEWLYYIMSWVSMIYDLCIPLLLLYTRTRVFAFIMVILFHVLTKVLFPIGMFPYIMIFSAIIFFSPDVHNHILSWFNRLFKKMNQLLNIDNFNSKIVSLRYFKFQWKKTVLSIVVLFFLFQFILPFRYLMYPGELLWHEQGYRFSWRVMLIEKTGLANFKIVNPDGSEFYVHNSDFLTPFQEKQMSFQPDLILEYAHYLGNYFSSLHNKNVQVFVENYVSLNGRKSQMLVSDSINLYMEKESFKNKTWIISLKDEIKGF